MNRAKLTLLFLSSLTIMAASLVAPALPSIAQEFDNLQNAEFLSRLVLSVPALFIALTASVAGKVIDKYGRMGPLYFGLILYSISGTAVYFANGLYIILIYRAILGIAIGLLSTVVVTLIGDYYQGTERSRFIGTQTSFIGFTGVAFLLFGGWLADISWRHPFLMYLLAIVLIPLCFQNLKETHTRKKAALEPLSITPLQIVIFITGFITMILFYIVPTQLPFIVRESGQTANAMSGIALAVNALGMMLTSLGFSRIVGGKSHATVFAFGFAIMGFGTIVSGLSGSYLMILGGMFIAGMGLGFVWPNINFWALELSNHNSRGRVMGILTTCFFLGQFISPIAAQPVISNYNHATLFWSTGALLILIGLGFLAFKSPLGKLSANTT